MIVRNEAQVVERCIASVRPIITHWCIVDTGSTDGTQELVAQALEGLPGTLHQRAWRNFGHNRTELMRLSRGMADYLLLVEPDGKGVPRVFHDLGKLIRGCGSERASRRQSGLNCGLRDSGVAPSMRLPHQRHEESE